MVTPFKNGPAALVIAHPGHELRVYGWLKLARPIVFILTDGSGRSGVSRLGRTTAILKQVGARVGPIYGRLTDAALYSAILDRDVELFASLADELAQVLVREKISYVVGDAIEGYNPGHDLCRLVVDASVSAASRAGRLVDNFEVNLSSPRDTFEQLPGAVPVYLDDQTLAEKVRVAREYSELTVDVEAVLKQESLTCLKTELLQRVKADRVSNGSSPQPFYEIYGAEQVAAGHYERLIRYREHLLPIEEALNSRLTPVRC